MNRNRTVLVGVAIALVVGLAATVLALTGGDEPSPTDGTAAPSPTATSATEPVGAATTDPGPEPTLDPTDGSTPSAAEPEMRGIWVRLFDRSLKTKENILAFLDTAAAANFNTVIVQAARRHDAFYDSDVLPRTTDDEMTEGLDMLGTLVPAAARTWAGRARLVLGRPDHARDDGRRGPRTGPRQEPARVRDGRPLAAGWQRPLLRLHGPVDPRVPGARRRHVPGRGRAVRRRRHPPRLPALRVPAGRRGRQLPRDAEPGAGATDNQHPVTMARYRDHGQGSLADFMRQQTEDLVRRIYLEVADVDPTVVVSGALIAQGDGPGANRDAFTQAKAYWNKGQDWATWIDQGILDEAFPMAYFRESDPRWSKAYDDWVVLRPDHGLGRARRGPRPGRLPQLRRPVARPDPPEPRGHRRRRGLQLPGDHHRGGLLPAAAGRPAASSCATGCSPSPPRSRRSPARPSPPKATSSSRPATGSR